MFSWLARLLRRVAKPAGGAAAGGESAQAAAGSAGGSDDSQSFGRLCEQTARAFLERAGFRIIAANYRCPLGELDLVAEGEARLVFVEVKARRISSPRPLGEGEGVRALHSPSPSQGEGRGEGFPRPAAAPRPESAVNRAKQKKIGRAAKYFCRVRHLDNALVRFDVIAIDWPDSGDPVIRHHKAAFLPDV